MAPRQDDGGNDSEKLRLRAVFVPRGQRAPDGMLDGMTDTIRIPVQGGPGGAEAPSVGQAAPKDDPAA